MSGLLASFETFRVVLFVAAVVVVYWLSIRWCIARMRHSEPASALARRFRALPTGVVLLGLAVFGLGCFAYGLFVEPNRLTVTYYRIDTPKVPRGEHVRIVHIADLHVRRNGPRERVLPELVRSLNPDLILHTGDFFDPGADEDATMLALLRSWSQPQYACRGNWDRRADLDKLLAKAGVRVLNADVATETIRGARISIAGFSPYADKKMPDILRQLPRDTFNIVLHHIPSGFPSTWDTPADLMLAGHTHGGQIRLPFYGALVTLDPSGKRWEYGYYDEHGVKLIVSRGIGCEPGIPEMRFLCPPEVVVIDLKGSAER